MGKKLSEMTAEEKQTLLEKGREGVKIQMEKMKKNLEEVRNNYADLMEIMIHDPKNFTALKAWQAFRLSLNIQHTRQAIEHYKEASRADSYEAYFHALRLVISELGEVPFVLDESEEEIEYEATLFTEAFNLGKVVGEQIAIDKAIPHTVDVALEHICRKFDVREKKK